MTCFYPLDAWRTLERTITFDERKGHTRLNLPCGQCIGCRMDRAESMAVRCMHEAKMHDESCAITLTYDEQSMHSTSLIYKDWQEFLAKLKRKVENVRLIGKYGSKRTFWSGRRVRFFMCGEYGEKYRRPHFHAILFGEGFYRDRIPDGVSRSGVQMYTSKTLDRVWGKGKAVIGDCTYGAAAYIARYCLKKANGPYVSKYEDFDLWTGEIIQREPEFGQGSLKPGIGMGYMRKFRRDFLNLGSMVVDGRKVKLPRYYKNYFELYDKKDYDKIAVRAEERMIGLEDNNSPERLKVRERVLQERLKTKKREADL